MEFNSNKSEKKINHDVSTTKSPINLVNDKLIDLEKQIKQKEQLISEFEDMLKNQKIRVQSYEGKIESINKQYNKFQEYKELLNKNINHIHENLIYKEEKINELEKNCLEKENELICEREKNLKQEEIIKQYKEQIQSMNEKKFEEAKKIKALNKLQEKIITKEEKIKELGKNCLEKESELIALRDGKFKQEEVIEQYKEKILSMNERNTEQVNEIKNLSYLRESSIAKEEKINELERNCLEKDNEILSSKDKISEYLNKNSLLSEEVENLKKQIKNLNLKIAENQNNSFFKRLFNKNNSETDR